MGAFAVGEVVIVPFPFSDRNTSKIRPAIVVADLPGRNCILCAVTSQDHVTVPGLPITKASFVTGGLEKDISYVLVSKLFTMDENRIRKAVGMLNEKARDEILQALRTLFTV